MSGKKTKTQKPVTKAPIKQEPDELTGSGVAELLQKILGKKIRIKCKNKKQKDFMNLIGEKEIVIAAGPPGSGKSFISIGKALELLQNKSNKFERLIIVKPAVEAEEHLGFLPGNLKDKLEPHLASSIDIVDKIVGKSNREKLTEAGIIHIEPLGFIRGKTLDNAIVVIEETQNISPKQMKTLLTRIGENSKYIISGDLNQSDKFKKFTETGLYDIFRKHREIDEIGFFLFGPEDIVRNPLISRILENYDEQSIFNDASLVEEMPRGQFDDLTPEDTENYRRVVTMNFERVNSTPDENGYISDKLSDVILPATPQEYDKKLEGQPTHKRIFLKIKYRLYYYLNQII